MGQRQITAFFFLTFLFLITRLQSVKGNPLRASRVKSPVYSNSHLLRFAAWSPRAQQAKETFPRQHLHPLLKCLRAKISELLETSGCGPSSRLSHPIALQLEGRRRELQEGSLSAFSSARSLPQAFSFQKDWKSSLLLCMYRQGTELESHRPDS